jgi:CheY-like chemotaxis protein
MPSRILVVDRNEAFAAMLQDMLVVEGGYHVEVLYTGSQALNRLQQTDFDLTIIDVDLDPGDMGYQTLIRQVRQLRPSMRLMLIPLMGEQLSAEADPFDIQGALSKPFFADDLLPNIQDALAKEVRPPSAAPPPPAPETPDPVKPGLAPSPDVQAILTDLARETLADAVLLVSAAVGREGILAQASTLGDQPTRALAEHGVTVVRAAQQAARLLGQTSLPFEHNMFEGESSRFYVMALAPDLLLVIVTPIHTPLGTIRHNLRRAGRDLSERALT